MNATTLQALRRLLFFSRPEAAAMIGQVTERSWNYWEDGGRPVPADVAERMGELLEWRRNALQAASATISDWMASLPADAEKTAPVVVWYDSIEDWMSLPDREPVLWRPHCSVIAELCATHGAVAVRFDGPAYAEWLGERQDFEHMRGQWAASISG